MTIATSAVLSAQEAAIESGRKILHGTATDRVIRLCDAIMASCSPRVALDRAVLFTESFKEIENQPPTEIDGPLVISLARARAESKE